MIHSLVSCLRYLQYRLRYPGARAAFHARITGRTSLGSGSRIGPGCRVHDTTVGRDCHIMPGTWIGASRLGDSVFIYPDCQVTDVEVGSYSYVGLNALVARVSIGRFTSVGPYFVCGSGEHPTQWISTSPVFYSSKRQCGVSFAAEDAFIESKPSFIGHDVWIGGRVYVRDGIRIGNGAIVAAGSTVTRDVADYAVVGGIPASVIRYRFPKQEIAALNRLRWWDWTEPQLRAARALFIGDDVPALLGWAEANGIALPAGDAPEGQEPAATERRHE
jgi:chloramphenicol O-acetyltransferase type B